MSRKACIHIGIIGHPGHGKTTLTSALKAVSDAIHGVGGIQMLEERPTNRTDGIRVRGAEVEYESLSRHYVHVDFASLSDYLKALVISAGAIHGVIVVVDANSGVEPGTIEQLALARAAGIERAVAFVNKVDSTDPVLVEASTSELRDALAAHGFADAPLLQGSARQAVQAAEAGALRHPEVKGIRRLVQALDDHIIGTAKAHAHDDGPASIVRVVAA